MHTYLHIWNVHTFAASRRRNCLRQHLKAGVAAGQVVGIQQVSFTSADRYIGNMKFKWKYAKSIKQNKKNWKYHILEGKSYIDKSAAMQTAAGL